MFIATTINYLDRSVIGVLAPTLRDKVFGWSMADYSYITTSFQLAYALGLLFMGGFVDRYGAKIGYALSILVWTVFNISHAFIRPAFGLTGFIVARFGLGLGESGNFPSCAKAITEWFPQDQRALATGVTNASTNIGAVLAPLLIPLLVQDDGQGWQYAFMFTSGFSLLWVVLWWCTYEKPPEPVQMNVSETNLPKMKWRDVLFIRETWAFAILKTTDAVWWFYLFFGGMFLADAFKLNISQLGLPLVMVYVLADLGSIGGGWISGYFLRRGWSVNRARKTTLLGCALLVMPVSLMSMMHNPWAAMGLMAMGAAGHQAWSVNIFTVVSDVIPKKAVSSVIGIGGMVGSLTSMLAFLTLGQTLKAGQVGGYFWPFIIAGVWYLIVLYIGHRMMPKLKMAEL